MTRFRATFPKEPTKPGMADVVYSYRDENGIRVEITKQIAIEQAERYLKNIIYDSKPKEPNEN